ncbi:MAG: C-GCAxxG-C-C family protein [Desulfotalea sp.]
MKTNYLIKEKVKQYYWDEDFNCATTNIKILSELFSLNLNQQVIDAAIGMHGAGKYGAQCGLVEGTLMFIGILGRDRNIPDDTIVENCKEYASNFECEFESLSCKILRPEGFHKENPPHLCEKLTYAAIEFNSEFIQNFLKNEKIS